MTTTLEVRVTADAEVDDAVFHKVFRRLMWFLFVLLVVSFMDRINIGFAALTMNKDLGLNSAAYGMSLTVFYVAYALCEIPSNLVLARVGARLWIAQNHDYLGVCVGSDDVRRRHVEPLRHSSIGRRRRGRLPTRHASLLDLLVPQLLSGPSQCALLDGDSSDHRHCLGHLRIYPADARFSRFGRLALVIFA